MLPAFDDDVNRAMEDLLSDCIGEFEQSVVVDDVIARREIGEVVTKMLVDENRCNWSDSFFILSFRSLMMMIRSEKAWMKYTNYFFSPPFNSPDN